MVQKILQENGEEPILRMYVSLSFYRRCALAALKDVHDYLNREEGHVAVKKLVLFLGFLLGWRTVNMCIEHSLCSTRYSRYFVHINLIPPYPMR